MNGRLLPCSHGDAIGVLPSKVFRSSPTGKTLLLQMIFRQCSTVPNEKHGAAQLPKMLGKIFQRDSTVLTETNRCAVPDLKQSIIDLTSPGVHDAAHGIVLGTTVPGHGFQSGDTDAGLIQRPGKSLDRGDPDTDPREGAGTLCHGEPVDILYGDLCILQQMSVLLWVRALHCVY